MEFILKSDIINTKSMNKRYKKIIERPFSEERNMREKYVFEQKMKIIFVIGVWSVKEKIDNVMDDLYNKAEKVDYYNSLKGLETIELLKQKLILIFKDYLNKNKKDSERNYNLYNCILDEYIFFISKHLPEIESRYYEKIIKMG